MGQTSSYCLENKLPFDLQNKRFWKAEILKNKRKIGNGPNGYVLEAINTETQTRCAIKILEYTTRDDPAYEYAFSKVRRLCQIDKWNNSNIVQTYLFERIEVENNFSLKHKMAIVMEYMDKNLNTLIKEKKASKTRFDENKLLKFTLNLLHGLSCAHNNGIYHTNIKDENVLYCSSWGTLKLGDFDIPENTSKYTNIKNLIYQPPELHYTRTQDTASETDWLKVDVFAAGIAILKLSLLKEDLSSAERKSLPNMVAEVAKISEKIASVLEGMLKMLPEERWSSDKCFKLAQSIYFRSHPENSDWDDLLTQQQKTAKILIEQGLTHKKKEELTPALKCFENAIRKITDTELLNYSDRDMIANCLNLTAQTHFELKQYTSSLSSFLKCLEIKRNFLNHNDNMSIIFNTGRVYVKLGAYQQGLCCYLKAYRLLKEKSRYTYNCQAPKYLYLMASAYEYLGDYYSALENQMLLLEMSKKEFGERHPKVGKAMRDVSRIFKSLGDADKGKVFENFAKKAML